MLRSVTELRGGIDLGGTKIQAIVVDEHHEVLGKARRPTPVKGGPEDVVEQLAGALEDAAADADVDATTVIGVGVGSPGRIDHAKGTVAGAGNLPGFLGDPVPMAPMLAERLGVARVALGNDVQVATNAELALGVGRDVDELLGVFWGTGVGGGVVLGGKLRRGGGSAGEIGHVCVDRGGHRCGCGRRGCVEAYAGRRSMEQRARKRHEKGEKTHLFKLMEKRGRDRLTSGVWEAALKEEDELAVSMIDDAVDALGTGIASALNVLDLPLVIIGGGLGVRLGQPYADRIREAMMPHLFADDRPPDVVVAALGDLGGALGAALLVAR
jgi:glucokinase